jgi:hypothetical protein
VVGQLDDQDQKGHHGRGRVSFNVDEHSMRILTASYRFQYAGGWSKMNSKCPLSDHAGRMVSELLFRVLGLYLTRIKRSFLHV